MTIIAPPDMRDDVESWDVRIERKWPFGIPRFDGEPVPPVRVYVGVNFTSEASALDFETKVRQLIAFKGATICIPMNEEAA